MKGLDLKPALERLGQDKLWKVRLESTLEDVVQGWALENLKPFENLSFNFVARAKRNDGSSVVLKIGDPTELGSEMDALLHYGGVGCVRLLEQNREQGAFLLERIEPGILLSSVQDEDESVQIACAVMKKLHKPPPQQHSFFTLERWLRSLFQYRTRFAGQNNPIPSDLLERAELYAVDLLASQVAPVVLHGDLHHFNLLSNAAKGWTVIDPKGLVGERAFEVGPFFYNPSPQIFSHPDLERVLSRRLDVFAETLELDRERLRQWAFIQGVLSACWTLEATLENGGAPEVKGVLRVARSLSSSR